MAARTITERHVCPHRIDHHSSCSKHQRSGLFRPTVLRSRSGFGADKGLRGLFVRRCRSFNCEDGGEVREKKKHSERKYGTLKENEVNLGKGSGAWSNLKVAFYGFCRVGSLSNEDFSKAIGESEEVFSSIAIQIGRYIVTMMSTGVILAIGFQSSGFWK